MNQGPSWGAFSSLQLAVRMRLNRNLLASSGQGGGLLFLFSYRRNAALQNIGTFLQYCGEATIKFKKSNLDSFKSQEDPQLPSFKNISDKIELDSGEIK
ncbi:MAG: hypothetical protein M3142_02855 [Bacteroidota bacterium]|nr:hypothetical protein [Bacteroidota bacterium]